MRIAINPEFEALIPKLRPEELELLEASLRKHGCRDPLVVWSGSGDILLDDHNGLKISERFRIPYNVAYVTLPDRDAALLWIEANQLGRRNLTDDQRAIMLDSVRERRAKISLANRPQNTGKATEETSSSVKVRTRTAVADEGRVSEWKLRGAQEVHKARPDLAAKVRTGGLTIVQPKREIREAKPVKVHVITEQAAPVKGEASFEELVMKLRSLDCRKYGKVLSKACAYRPDREILLERVEKAIGQLEKMRDRLRVIVLPTRADIENKVKGPIQ
jgi:hypothetical protein